MLKLSHIKKSYKKNEVLTDISFTFEEGQIYPILGGPGAGRTTLFECICGDISVDDGSIVTIDKCKYFYAAKQSSRHASEPQKTNPMQRVLSEISLLGSRLHSAMNSSSL